jgi:hypothetical protein
METSSPLGSRFRNSDMPASSRLLVCVLFAMTLFAAAPLRAADLEAIEKTIGKQPAYRTEPRYCLLLFGAEAKIRVWIVEDGRTLYVDRNANGDLTDDGPPLQPTEVRNLGSLRGGPKRWDFDYVLDEIKPSMGPAQTKFRLARWNYGEKEDSYGLSVTLHDDKPPREKTGSDLPAGTPSASSAADSEGADAAAPDDGIPMYAGWFGNLWADSPACGGEYRQLGIRRAERDSYSRWRVSIRAAAGRRHDAVESPRAPAAWLARGRRQCRCRRGIPCGNSSFTRRSSGEKSSAAGRSCR